MYMYIADNHYLIYCMYCYMHQHMPFCTAPSSSHSYGSSVMHQTVLLHILVMILYCCVMILYTIEYNTLFVAKNTLLSDILYHTTEYPPVSQFCCISDVCSTHLMQICWFSYYYQLKVTYQGCTVLLVFVHMLSQLATLLF